MPQPKAPETYVTELDRDPAFVDVLMPIRKFVGSVPGHEIISPPPLQDTENPIDAVQLERSVSVVKYPFSIPSGTDINAEMGVYC